MPLDPQKLFINFSKGVDSGKDPKTVIPSKFTKLDNLEWDKTQTVRQRPGYTKATITAHNAVAVANVHQLHVLGAEILLEAQSGFSAFAQDHVTNRDKLNGHPVAQPLERAQVDFTDVTASLANQTNFDAAAADPSGLECWAWVEQVPFASSSFNAVRYRIVDGKTRAVLQEGLVAGAGSSVDGANPRVLVRNNAGGSRFYIYFSVYTHTGPVYSINCCHVDVAAGSKIPGALSGQTVIVTGLSGVNTTFDAWYDLTGDVVLFAFQNATNNLTLSILTGSDGATVAATSDQAVTGDVGCISVTAVYSGATGYALAVYAEAGGGVRAFSTKFDGSADLDTALTAGSTSDGLCLKRLSVIASPYVAGQALVFYDTKHTTASYAPYFQDNIGFVTCLYNGSSPTLESVFARGLTLQARPVTYSGGPGGTGVCITAALVSTLQPTIFLLSFGSESNAVYGFGTIAAGTHTPPRVLARILPGTCYLGPREIYTRLATPLAIIS